jgi:chromosome segregation ATPase
MAAWKESEAKYEETVSERNDLREKVEELIEEARAQQESVKSLQSDIAKLEVAKEQARSQYEDQLRLAHQTREEAAVYADKLQADIVSLKFRAEQEKKPILADLDNEKRKNAELEKLGEELKEENASIRATLSALQTRLQVRFQELCLLLLCIDNKNRTDRPGF